MLRVAELMLRHSDNKDCYLCFFKFEFKYLYMYPKKTITPLYPREMFQTIKQSQVIEERTRRMVRKLVGTSQNGPNPPKVHVLEVLENYIGNNPSFDPTAELLVYITTLWPSKDGQLTLLDLLVGDYINLFEHFATYRFKIFDNLAENIIGVQCNTRCRGMCGIVTSEIFKYVLDNNMMTLTPECLYTCVQYILKFPVHTNDEISEFMNFMFEHCPQSKYQAYLDRRV